MATSVEQKGDAKAAVVQDDMPVKWGTTHGLSDEDAEFLELMEGREAKRINRKIDFHIIPILAALYLFSHVDRGNLGNAKIEGMDKDIGLVGNQYNIASTLFFVPYIIFEIPSNAVLQKMKPRIWLAILVVSWGTVMTLMGIVKNFAGMVLCRVFLGLCEAGLFPGAIYLVTNWYPRHEVQQRLALLYTSSALSGALGGLLAYAISLMDGVGGLAGWRWIFLLEGFVPVAFGLILPFILTDAPESARWLSDEEKRLIDLRLRVSGVRSATGEGDKFSWHMLLKILVDWQIWLGIIIAWVNSVPNSAFNYTMPKIINGLGFTAQKAQLLTIPPYFCGAVSSYVSGYFADRFTWRFPFIAAPMLLMATAFAILFSFDGSIDSHVGPMYFAVILAQVGIYPLLPGISAWTGNNLATSWKRSMGLAWLISAGDFGSFIGTNIFLDREAPRYQTGYGVSLGIIVLGILAASCLELALWRLNKAKEAVPESVIRSQYRQEELDKMGEKSPLFRHTL